MYILPCACLSVRATVDGTYGIASVDYIYMIHIYMSHLFAGIRDLVKRHAIHLNGVGILLLLEVNVAHVHTEAPCLGILLVLDD